jgi:hypothetical protein
MVIGKLLSALSYVFLLILASVPIVAVVFVFGGVGPEDVARAYALLFSLAFGMGAVGLFISALVRRTQTATVLTFIVVLALSLGSAAVHEFWTVLTSTAQSNQGGVVIQKPNRAPVALLWLNPFVGDLDLICTTAPGGYESTSCDYIAAVTGTPFFGSTSSDACSFGKPCSQPMLQIQRGVFVQGGIVNDVVVGGAVAPVPVAAVAVPVAGGQGAVPDDAVGPDPSQQLPGFGFPRDTFWPQSAAAFLMAGVILTLLASQLVAPTRRLHLPRRRRAARPSLPPPSSPDEVPV